MQRIMEKDNYFTGALAASITRAASRQTYYTIRFLADGDRVPDAFKAYAYFRWVDDHLDADTSEKSERFAFLTRQKALIDRCYRGDVPSQMNDEEHMLVDLIRGDRENNSGLQSYIRNMMAMMVFDAERRGRFISQHELGEYTRWLAVAVTEAMHYFIGHNGGCPRGEARYLAVTGAHITHMLRDTLDDACAGYFNIPLEFLQLHRIDPRDVESTLYQNWVRSRVNQARACFEAGRRYLAQVENRRCRIAGFAYTARFERVLNAIEQDGYRLRSQYPECASLWAAMRMGWSALSLSFNPRRPEGVSRVLSVR